MASREQATSDCPSTRRHSSFQQLQLPNSTELLSIYCRYFPDSKKTNDRPSRAVTQSILPPVTAQPRARHPCLLSESNPNASLQSSLESVVSVFSFLGRLQAWPPTSADTRGRPYCRLSFAPGCQYRKSQGCSMRPKPGRVGYASCILTIAGHEYLFLPPFHIC